MNTTHLPETEDCNTSSNPSLNEILDARLSRRSAMRLGVGGAGSAVLASFGVSACGGGDDALAPPAAAPAPAPAPTPITLGFEAVPKSLADTVVVPAGYTAKVIYALGDPIDGATPAYKNDGTDTDFDKRAGDHHDGMEYFGLNAAGTARDPAGSERGLIAMNHEATSHSGLASTYLHADGGTDTLPRPAAEVDREIAIHGLSVVEVRRGASGHAVQAASGFNRRVTPLTPVQILGPARGNALMVTRYSADGTQTRGTINNCGTGSTPWGTFLTGEENWAGYFTRAAADDTARGGATARSVVSLRRYGRNAGAASRHGWETGGAGDVYARWNISQTGAADTDDYRNELNTFGYIVEMDPYDKTQAIRKRTALGRFAHESASFGKVSAGKPLAVYMGDDSRGEYIYKFVSSANWSAADADPANRITTGDKYLDAGKLYVARFNADGTGNWIELSIANLDIANYATYDFADQADVVVNARLAADAVGATKMDRPEWCAVHPVTGEVYYTLTNNSNRKLEPASSSQMAVDAANPRSYTDAKAGVTGSAGNVHGHILRLRENGSETAATAFTWDVYLFGAEAGADLAKVNLSALTADQDFSAPDGLWFSPKTGLCFIQTDDGAYTDVTNCMMLVGIPGSVGDGEVVPLNYTKGDGSTVTVNARVGAKPTASTLRRFLVGPVDCEITGICETPDGRALFVNIQHPGETIVKADIGDPGKYVSHWPGNAGYGAGGANARPRSATVVITRNDGGLVAADGTAVLNNN
ncbi:PhoX family protein [Ramlibacter rhizophilus]|uniref:PhoX family phosphatase n=1 Tax=Ramlibacter rhizophilus TaxID=1781167 RepID=A0A4Z0BEX3_9BURK|nr:PhoX family phosphatase [Ramlibacter rhizophilus]TFY97876.1 PhoX family phosphatase [Ramlibacter rhizophilus]